MSDWRKQFILKQFTKKGLGLEIGPSHSPLAPKKDGYNIEIVDHASQKKLIKKYKALNIDTSNIEEVDYVWDGKQTLSELINKPKSYDYIIASHLVEHTTDLVTFLQDCEKLLKPAGKLCLVIPDKRYCFDYFRFPSTTGDILEAYYNKNIRHTSGKVFDFLINSAKRGKNAAWSSNDRSTLSLMYELKFAKQESKKAQKSESYIDIHNWMFTPNSLKLLVYDLQSLGLIKLAYADEMPTQGFEFFAVLSSKSPLFTAPRVKMLTRVMEDVKEMYSVDQANLKKETATLNEQIGMLEAEILAMKNSKRWRIADKPAKVVKALRKK